MNNETMQVTLTRAETAKRIASHYGITFNKAGIIAQQLLLMPDDMLQTIMKEHDTVQQLLQWSNDANNAYNDALQADSIIGLDDSSELAIVTNVQTLVDSIANVQQALSLGTLYDTVYKGKGKPNHIDAFISIKVAIVRAPKGHELEGQQCFLTSSVNGGVVYSLTLQPDDPVVYRFVLDTYAKARLNNENIGVLESVVHKSFNFDILVETSKQLAMLVRINRSDNVYETDLKGNALQASKILGKDSIIADAANLQRKFVNMVKNHTIKPTKDSVYNYKDNNNRYVNKIYREYVDSRIQYD